MRKLVLIIAILLSFNAGAQILAGSVGIITNQAVGVTYATLSPTNKSSNITLSGGNLTATTGAGAFYSIVLSTIGKSSGKWYGEFTCISNSVSGWFDFGIAVSTVSLGTYLGGDGNGWGYIGQDGQYWNNGAGNPYGATYQAGDVIGIALDMDNKFVYLSKNNVWQNSGVPTSGALGTGAMVGGLFGTVYMSGSGYEAIQYTANFGATAFTYTPPAGYSGLHL